MRICFIEDTPLHGGTQIWVAEAIRFALAQGEEVTLLAPKNSWIIEQVRGTGAEITAYDWAQPEAKIWADALKNSAIALATVHPPRGDFHCIRFAGQVIQAGNLPTVLIPKTGTIVPEYERAFYQPAENIRSAVIAIAKFTQRYLIENYHIPAEKTHLIYQGVNLRRFHASPKMRTVAEKRYLLPANAAPLLGCIGSFEKRKGQAVLLEALALAKQNLPDFHLLLVGDGADESKLKKQVAELDLTENVSFFPFTRDPELLFARVDLTILPSIGKEGLPNVLLESLAMGTPVIASDFGGIPEVIIDGETGILVPPADASQLRDAILHLWKNPALREKMSINAVELMRENFDKEKQFAKFFQFFEQIIAEAITTRENASL